MSQKCHKRSCKHLQNLNRKATKQTAPDVARLHSGHRARVAEIEINPDRVQAVMAPLRVDVPVIW